MSRTPNRIKTVSLRLSTTEAIYRYLELLVTSGVYGKNPAEAAEQLIARNIVRALEEINELPETSGQAWLKSLQTKHRRKDRGHENKI